MQMTVNRSRVGYRLAALLAAAVPILLRAADAPYLVTYTHQMEEPGNLEVALNTVTARPEGGNRFLNHLMELEYGATAWWTTELYLSGQGTSHEGVVFTGYRWENRFRPLLGEHWINPVLYVEFSNTSGADKSLKEIVGHDGFSNQLEPNDETTQEHKREIETKLILSSNVRGWNFSENIIAEKNLANEPWEFGYAVAVSRPLALAASSKRCVLCRENLSAGLEMYGGLGTRHEFGLRDTSHYLAPAVGLRIPNGPSFKFSLSFGLNGNSYPVFFRFTMAYEVNQFRRLFRGKD
ncbi:MAG: hypothetical protein C5B51_27685 [Terriglobia bacterium]|nr:MAG: hypothetical protein C5B51_27685 [Terriglobia bacterium]